MRWGVGVLGLVALFVAPAPTAAAATWSAPLDVSSSSNFIESPFIGFDRLGGGLAAWRWQDGVGRDARSGVRIASRSASGGFGEEGIVRRRRQLSRIKVAFGRTNGRLGRPRTVDTVQTFRAPVADANDAGQIALAYIRSTRGVHRAVKLFVSRGRRLGRPRVISRGGGVNSVAVAVGPRGDIVVAWERGGRIEARIRRRGHHLGRIIRVGRGAKLGTRLRAAVARSGRAWIAWSSQALSEGGDNGPFRLYSAVSSSRRTRFRRPQLLDRYDRRASDEAAFDLVLDRKDNGLIAWSSFDGRNFRARVGFGTRAGRFIRFETLSQEGSDAVVGDLATSRRAGEAVVVWSRLDAVGEVGTSVLAGYLPPGGGYPGEEQVSLGDRARKPAVAFDLRTGLPTAVWSQREGPDGPGVPLAQVRTFLRASTRTP